MGKRLMDIKEIAMKVGLQVFEEHPYDKGHVVSPSGYTWIDDKLIEFAEALIESYKAELLKEVGEPGAYFSDEFFSINTKQNATFNDPLFTSDQLAATILKATKPLEEEIERLKVRHSDAWVEIEKLRAQLAAAQEEIRASDIVVAETISGLLAESSLLKDQLAKAEQLVAEWQPIDTAPKDGVWILCKSFRRLTTEQSREISWNGKCWATRDCSRLSDPTHWMSLPKAPNVASS